MNMTVSFYKSKICFLLPTVAVRNMREYYGYNVVYAGVTWLKWQLIMKFGVKKEKDIEH
jgi:hypothetical protein